ncbi:hypothetical protein CISG_08746 [Coccidioides immitis RMSCC 3703]|uniref:Uncharacterized protein n=1 Tax=Coccidioides immitis RMSCC 3703 TaxID=454286 RepID=A0A0J8U281_COCIT|nr:hypothetical protein CISG_08746 [Coccidioides immitis RMSCC 3703]
MPWMLLLIPGDLEAFKSSEMVSLSNTMKGKKPSPPHFIGIADDPGNPSSTKPQHSSSRTTFTSLYVPGRIVYDQNGALSPHIRQILLTLALANHARNIVKETELA